MAEFRKLIASTGKIALAGRDAETNEKLIEQAGAEEYVLHTKAPGSPFVNIKLKDGEKASKRDVKEAAIFCAYYSRAWKKAKIKKDILVHIFKGRDIFKTEEMKTGTFLVRKFKEIKVKKEEIERFGERWQK